MSTPDIKTSIENLRKDVNSYTGKGKKTSVLNLEKYKKKIYIGVPILVFLLLLVFKPDMVTTENDKGKRVYSFSKLILWWLVITAVLIIGFFAYNYKKNKD